MLLLTFQTKFRTKARRNNFSSTRKKHIPGIRVVAESRKKLRNFGSCPTLLADETKGAEKALKAPAWPITPLTMRKSPRASTKGMGKGDLCSKEILSVSILRSLDFVKGRESGNPYE